MFSYPRLSSFVAAAALLVVSPGIAVVSHAAEPFEAFLKKHCIRCHGPEKEKGAPALMNAAENTLKHAGGAYGPAHMASKATILDATMTNGEAPLGCSGIQIRLETDRVIEGIRPTRVVRVRPADWPNVRVPREEYLVDGTFSLEDRFPPPAIFPKY